MRIFGRTDCFFVRPSFLSGMASVFDLGGTLRRYHYVRSRTPQEADAWAIANDWAVVGQDLAVAIEDFGMELAKSREPKEE
jgi:hypothetical protein